MNLKFNSFASCFAIVLLPTPSIPSIAICIIPHLILLFIYSSPYWKSLFLSVKVLV